MSFDVRSVTVKLKADIAQFQRDLVAVAMSASGLPKSLAASSAAANRELSSLERELKRIAAGRYAASVLLEDQDAAQRLDELNARLDLFGTKVSDARLDVDDVAAQAKISSIEAELIGLAHTTADPNIDLRGVAKAEAQIAALERQLDNVGNGPGGGWRGFLTGLNDSNDRMSSLVQTAVALGPALIPVVGAGATGAAALGTSLTFAATGAGVAALALHGVGDALDALNKYKLDPTQTNLDALRLKLQQLAPAGQDFVFFLEGLKPKLQALQSTAQAGFLPGLQDGIDSMMHEFPVVQQLVSSLSSELGTLASQAGHELDSPFWHGFLETFSRDASTALGNIAKATGNVIQGFAGMFEAFVPLGQSVSSELLDLSRDFAAWGEGLSTNRGFQSFVDYARENAPLVAHALGAISNAFIAVVQAGAPIGHDILPVITLMADGFAAIAKSPAGPVLFGLASGVAALARSMALLKALNATTLIRGVQVLGGPETTAAAARLRLLGAGVGVLALSLTDLDNKAGLSNTLTGASLGLVGGGWGVAIGGAIGLVKDLTSANDSLESSMTRADHAFDFQSTSIQAAASSLRDLRSQYADYQANITKARSDINDPLIPFKHPVDFFHDLISIGSDDISHSGDKAKAQIQQQTILLQGLRAGWSDFAHDLGGDQSNFDEISTTLQKLGYSTKFINDQLYLHGRFGNKGFTAADANEYQNLVQQVRDYNTMLGGVPGRTQAVTVAIAGLDDPLQSAATDANNLATALNNLVAPQLNAKQAADQWIVSLAGLRQQLKQINPDGIGPGSGLKGAQARVAIEGQISAFLDTLEKGAAGGESGKQFVDQLNAMYQGLVHAGAGAGIAASDIEDLLRSANLGPAVIKRWAEQASGSATQVAKAYNNLPKDVRTHIATEGVPQTQADMDALQKKYHLTPSQILTIILAQDNAGLVIDGVRAELERLNGRTAVTYIDTVHREFVSQGYSGGHSVIDNNAHGNLIAYAGGGFQVGGLPAVGNQPSQIRGRGQGALLWNENPHSEWEGFVSGDPADKQRSMGIVDQIADRLRPGSRVEWMANGGLIGQRSVPGWSGGRDSAGFDRVARELRAVRTAMQDGSQRSNIENPNAIDARALAAGLLTSDLTAAFAQQMADMDRVDLA